MINLIKVVLLMVLIKVTRLLLNLQKWLMLALSLKTSQREMITTLSAQLLPLLTTQPLIFQGLKYHLMCQYQRQQYSNQTGMPPKSSKWLLITMPQIAPVIILVVLKMISIVFQSP